MKKKITPLKLVLFTITVLLLFFTAIEVIQRVRYAIRFHSSYWLRYGFAAHPRNYNQMMDRILLQKNNNQEVVEVTTINYNEGGSERYRKYNPKFESDEKINSYGFRGDEFNIDKAKGVCRIVLLGGSTTFGVGVEDDFTIADFLERKLNAGVSGKKFEVINAGIAASDISEILNLFKFEILPLKPDIIIVNSVFNNLYRSELTYESDNISLRKVNQFLLGKSMLYMTLREKLAILFHQKMSDIYKATSQQMLKNFLTNETFWVKLESDYTNIADLATSSGIKVMIVEEPIKLGTSQEGDISILLNVKFEPIYERIYSLLDDVAQNKKIAIIKASSYFRELPQGEELFTDGVHLTVTGNQYLADLIAEHIRKIR